MEYFRRDIPIVYKRYIPIVNLDKFSEKYYSPDNYFKKSHKENINEI